MTRRPSAFKAALNMLHMSGLDTLCAPVTRGAGVILMLHQVRPEATGTFAQNRNLSITPDFLERVIRIVSEAGFDIISMDDVAERTANPAGRPFAAFTFDDGYRDNRDYAYPILKSYGVPFTVYVAPGYADGHGELWWLTLEDAVRAGKTLSLEIDGRYDVFDCATPDQQLAAFNDIYWALRSLPDLAVKEVVRALAAQAGVDPLARGRELLMTWDELRDFAADPLVTIGAHTVNHVAVALLPEDEARREMAESVARVSEELGRPCRHFAYPYGDPGSVSDRDVRIAADLGLETAVTTAKAVVPANGVANMHALGRCSLNGDYQNERYLKVLLSGLPFAVWNRARGVLGRMPAYQKCTATPPSETAGTPDEQAGNARPAAT